MPCSPWNSRPPRGPPSKPFQRDTKRNPRGAPSTWLPGTLLGAGNRWRWGEGAEAGGLPQCLPFQEEAGPAVLGASGDGQAGEPTLGERVPGPAASSLVKEEAERTAGEARPAPSCTQNSLAQRLPGAEVCRGGDPGSGLRPRVEVRGWGHPGPPPGIEVLLPASAPPNWVASSAHSVLCSGSGLCCVSGCFLVTLSSQFLSFGATILLCPHPALCNLPHPLHMGMTLTLCQGTPCILAAADPATSP